MRLDLMMRPATLPNSEFGLAVPRLLRRELPLLRQVALFDAGGTLVLQSQGCTAGELLDMQGVALEGMHPVRHARNQDLGPALAIATVYGIPLYARPGDSYAIGAAGLLCELPASGPPTPVDQLQARLSPLLADILQIARLAAPGKREHFSFSRRPIENRAADASMI